MITRKVDRYSLNQLLIRSMALPYRNLNNNFSSYQDILQKYSTGKITLTNLHSFDELLNMPYHGYYVLSGHCRLLIGQGRGVEKVNAVLKHGSFLPFYSRSQIPQCRNSLFLEPYPEVEFLVFDKNHFEELIIENREFLLKIMTFYGNLSTSLQYDMSEILYSNGLKRVVNFLYNSLSEYDDQENPTIPATQELLASYISMDRTNVAKYLKELKEMGIIKTIRGKIMILDRQAIFDMIFK